MPDKKVTKDIEQDMINWKYIDDMNYDDIVKAVNEKYKIRISPASVTYHTETKPNRLEPQWDTGDRSVTDDSNEIDSSLNDTSPTTDILDVRRLTGKMSREQILKEYMKPKKASQVMRLHDQMGGKPSDLQYVLEALEIPLHEQKTIVLDIYGKDTFAKIFPTTDMPKDSNEPEDEFSHHLDDIKRLKLQQLQAKKQKLVEKQLNESLEDIDNKGVSKDPLDQLIRLETADRVISRGKKPDTSDISEIRELYKTFKDDSKISEFTKLYEVMSDATKKGDATESTLFKIMESNLQSEREARRLHEERLARLQEQQMELQRQQMEKEIDEAKRRSMSQEDWTNHIMNSVNIAKQLGYDKDSSMTQDNRLAIMKEASQIATQLGQQLTSTFQGFMDKMERTQMQNQYVPQGIPVNTPNTQMAMRSDSEREMAYESIENGLVTANQISNLYNRIKKSS